MQTLKPYYDADGITIHHGDCREILPTLGKFDLLLTDPPYGLGRKLHDGGTWSTHPKYDAMMEWDNQRPIAIDFQCAIIAIVWGGHLYQLPISRCWLIWKKLNSVPTMADFEMAWTNLDKPGRCLEYRIHPDGVNQHPTQKPLALMTWCLSFAPNAETVIDPFMGSGTTLVAAKLKGLKATGIEINEEYCRLAVERLRQGVLIPA